MLLPALNSQPSTEYLPLSADTQRKYRQELEHYMLSFRFRPDMPFYSRQVGRLLAILGAHEAACQFFDLSIALERGPAINGYTKEFFRQQQIPFDDDRHTQNEIIGSFIVISELSPQDALLLRLMDSMDIEQSKRGEFRSEFYQLARRYQPQKQALLSAPEKSTTSETKQKRRQLVDWRSIELPPGLKWPSRTYSEAAKLGVSILEHLEMEWKDLIAAGVGTRQIVEALDHTTIIGIRNFVYGAADKKRRTIPAHLLPLTKSQALDRALQEDPSILDRDYRVLQTLGSRMKRAGETKNHQKILTATPR